MEHQLARDASDDLGSGDNSLVIFTSENGPSGGFSSPPFFEVHFSEASDQLYTLKLNPAKQNSLYSTFPDKVRELREELAE